MANNFSLRLDVTQERKPYQTGSGASTSVRFKVITEISDIYVVDPGGAQGSVQLDKELFYTGIPDLQIYEFVSGELRQYSGGSLLPMDVTFSTPVFGGPGLDDMTLPGAFTGTAAYDYVVTVVDDGVTDPNTFNWTSTSGGSGTGVAMAAGTPVELEYGVSIQFAAQTGHTAGNTWSFTAYPLNMATFAGAGGDLNDIIIGTDFSGSNAKQYVVEVDTIISGAVASFSDNGSGYLRVTTVAPHGLTNPTDYVYILNSTNYSGALLTTSYVDPSTFDVSVSYIAEVVTTQSFEKINTFTWMDDGVVLHAGVSMSTSPVTLSDDFAIQFGAVIGHTAGNIWTIPIFVSADTQKEVVAEADYFRFADVTDFTGTIDDPSSLSDFYKANRWVFVPSTGTGIPDKWVMREYDSTDPNGTPYTGSMTYPTKFRSPVFIADFASLDAAERHAEFVRNIINAFTKEYNALMNSSFSTYEGEHPGNIADYTFPQY